MSKPAINIIELSDTLSLAQWPQGWALWDSTQSMNIALYAKDERAALVAALGFYQRRAQTLETRNKRLSAALDAVSAAIAPLSEED